MKDLKLKYIVSEKGNTKEFICKLSEVERGLFKHQLNNRPQVKVLSREIIEIEN